MKRTWKQSTNLATEKVASTWEMIVTSVNYVTREVEANYGNSSPHLRLSESVDLGTEQNPLVTPGFYANVERRGDDLVIVGFRRGLPLASARQVTTQSSMQSLETPTITECVYFGGGNIRVGWTNVIGGANYELVMSPCSDLSTASSVYLGSDNSWSGFLGTSPSAQLLGDNRGFENGNLTDFTNAMEKVFYKTTNSGILSVGLSSASKKSGAYSASMFVGDAGGLGSIDVFRGSDLVSASPSSIYTESFWSNIHESTGTPPNVAGAVVWFDSNSASISVSYFTGATTASTWCLYSGSMTSPSNTAFASVGIGFYQINPLGTRSLYLDDLSFIGAASGISSSALFSVRALGTYGQSSNWSDGAQPAFRSVLPSALTPTNTQYLRDDGTFATPAMVSIQDSLLTSSVSSMDFTVPTGYKHLVIECALRTDRPNVVGDGCNIQFNGDSASSYDSLGAIIEHSACVITTEFLNHTSGLLMGVPSLSSAASTFAAFTVHIPRCSSSAVFKSYHSDGYMAYDITTGTLQRRDYGGTWRSGSPITSIKLISSTGANFVANSRATLYGLS